MGNRKYELPLAELIDKITITQLRETLLNTDWYEEELRNLEHDIDLVMSEKNIVFNAKQIRIIFFIAQINTLIWGFKEKMGSAQNSDEYVKYLKLAHQVNGLKNALKNRLMAETDGTGASLKTNFTTDGLDYHVSI